MITRRTLVAGTMCLLAIIATIVLTGHEVAAQVKAAYVKIVDQPGRIPYQEYVEKSAGDFATCTTDHCALQFPQVPAGKRLVIEHLSVVVQTAGQTDALLSVEATPTEPNLSLGLIEERWSPQLLLGHRSLRYYVEPERVPFVNVLVRTPGTFSFGTATVIGYLVDAN